MVKRRRHLWMQIESLEEIGASPHAQERANVLIMKVIQLRLLITFLDHIRAIKSDKYCGTIRNLHRSIKNKIPELIVDGVVLVNDNARQHLSRSHTRN
ncbi:hypothetical protein TNCV_2096811 [Trichonephila clavipes]|nr:hypothetical protein TNCV_2096811 [Trichonephila clavipes]